MPGASFKYGMPLLCAAWPPGDALCIGGGGGATSSGITNRLVFAEFKDGDLSDQQDELKFDKDKLPLRCALHPTTNNLLVALGHGGMKLIKWESESDKREASKKQVQDVDAFSQLEEVSCMAFSKDGKLLCAGFERGSFVVWEWPEMKQRARCREDAEDFSSLKDIDIYCDGDACTLATTTENGRCEIWDVGNKKLGTWLDKLKAGLKAPRFGHCKFSSPGLGPRVLYTTANSGLGAHICAWRVSSCQDAVMVRKAKIFGEPCSAFSISDNGSMLAAGCSNGTVAVYASASLLPLRLVPNAHMIFVTGITFQQPSREAGHKTDDCGVLSISADASARVTLVKPMNDVLLRLSIYWPFALLLILMVVYVAYQLSRQQPYLPEDKQEL
eukprot:evm.model.scf_1807.4 EVM.evm.TU.scf_1807.4   scf_1807:26953-31852(-)